MAKPNVPLKEAVPSADDPFHILRDCRALYLKQLGQLLQEAQRVPASTVQAFQQTVGEYFDEMVSARRRSGFDVAQGLTASRISLVGESDLELEIRLGEFTAHLLETTGGDLWRVYLRFVTLLNRPELGTGDNPVGPKGIALGLIEFCAQLGENHEQTLARIDRLENYFAEHLSVLYDTLNNFLAERKVGAAQPAIITAPNSLNSSATPVATATATANPAIALQKSLLGPGNDFQLANSGPASNLLSQAMLNQLLARLDELEKSGKLTSAPPAANASTATHPSLESLIPGLFTDQDESPVSPLQALKSSELGIPTGAPEAATIDTLALIFEAIFASTILPEVVKTALSSLQISLLKAAMLDANFFADKAHPARLLLDKIARAALGLPTDIPSSHLLATRIQAIATKVRSEFTNDVAVFERQIGELSTLIAERDGMVDRSAEAYLPLLHQVERRNQAARRCRQVVEKHLEEGAPAEIAAFLRSYWQKVLLVIWMETGEQSAAWLENVDLVDKLLWSIQPKNDLEERKQLAKMLQPMVQRLNAGMKRIGVPDEIQAAFLDTCFALQTAAMRGTPGKPPEKAEEMPENKPEETRTDSELASGTLLLKIFDQAGETPNASWLRPPPVRTGSWLLLSLEDQPPLCGRLCPGSPESSLLLIANPDWNFALAIHPARLESMLASGAARTCSNDSLFDSAAEKALHRTTRP